MEKVVFDGNDFGKKSFSLIPDFSYEVLDDEYMLGKEIGISVRDSSGNDVAIAFRVIRDVHLGNRQRWLYGEVLADDGIYRQIEIKRYKGQSHLDSVEVFPQAPPIPI